MLSVSACILSFNRPLLICSAIESILRQTIKPSEIIIFDNGSNIAVYNAIRHFLDFGVVWVGADGTRSASWNFHRAVHAANSELVFVLHDDDLLCPEYIDQQVSFLQLNPLVGAVTCNGYLVDPSGRRNGNLVIPSDRSGSVQYFTSPTAVAMSYLSDRCLPFSPTLYRTCFIRGRSFSSDYGKVGDAVLFCELAKDGHLAYVPTPLYECRYHPGQDSSFFPEADLDKLDEYFLNDACECELERNQLIVLMRRRFASHTLRLAYLILLSPRSSMSSKLKLLTRFSNSKFSVNAAFYVCAQSASRRLARSFSFFYCQLSRLLF